MTVDALARRYRALLACYPRWYREERGAELVGTLLEGARPGQVRPSGREARALILEGLRLRAGTSAHRTPRASLIGGLQVAVLLLITLRVLGDGTELGRGPDGPYVLSGPAWWALAAAVVLSAMALFGLVAAGRFGLAAPAAVVSGVVTTVGYPALVDETGLPMYRHVVSAVLTLAGVVALALLGRNQGRITAGPVMLAWAIVPPLILVLPSYLGTLGLGDPASFYWFANLLVYVPIYLGALAYAAVDPRPALALAFALTILLVQIVAIVAQLAYLPGDVLVVVSSYLGLAAVAGVAGWLGLRWQRAVRPLGVRG